MIRSLHVKNFRGLRDVEIDFEPLTVLVGANASGKTAVLSALDSSAEISAHEIWQHGSSPAWFSLTFADGLPQEIDFSPKPIQIVLATHSAELLDHVGPEEVRFLSRDPADGSVQVRRIDTNAPDWRAAYREYDESLGSAWLSGGLGGVPGTGTNG